MSDNATAMILAALARLEAEQTQLRVDLMARLNQLQSQMCELRGTLA